MAEALRFGEVLEAAERLSEDEQETLLDILDRPLAERRRTVIFPGRGTVTVNPQSPNIPHTRVKRVSCSPTKLGWNLLRISPRACFHNTS